MTGDFLRQQLLDRRQRLEAGLRQSGGIAQSRENTALTQLLKEVDAALGRMEAGSYGICEACHDSIEKDRLLRDPLVRYCLDHLTFDQQRALEQDLELASRIQRELLPRHDLRLDGWEVAFHYEPLGPVSGDYCDVVVQENGSKDVFFLVGDVSGKGIAASMLMAHLHAIFRTLIASDLAIHEMVERAGRIFCESTMSGLFATLICARAGESGAIEISNAGHCPALWLKGKEVTKLETAGVPLGMFSNGRYTAQELRSMPGDTLVLYTDGLTEAESRAHEEYGEGRLTEVLSRHAGQSPEALVRACLDDLKAFRSEASPADDLTLMVVRRVA